jgi:hypothetical protein
LASSIFCARAWPARLWSARSTAAIDQRLARLDHVEIGKGPLELAAHNSPHPARSAP